MFGVFALYLIGTAAAAIGLAWITDNDGWGLLVVGGSLLIGSIITFSSYCDRQDRKRKDEREREQELRDLQRKQR